MNRWNSGLQEDDADIGVRAHCLRVATWSSELAGAIGLSESERKLVEQAAISHHIPAILVDDQARARLLAEMRLEADGEQPLVAEDVRIVLESLWGRRPISDPAMGQIVAVLEISDDFDQYFESEPFSTPAILAMNAQILRSKPCCPACGSRTPETSAASSTGCRGSHARQTS
jgi:hypothetical protein